ncbi:MAG: hypothetical protein AMXMBFR66_15530 [Pseudomonadota bacterium]
MSQAENSAAGPQQAPPEGELHMPGRLFATAALAFLLPVFVIWLLASFVFGGKTVAGGESTSAEAVARRLQRVGTIELREAASAAAPRTGEELYTAVCSACHGSGAAGAPKFGDQAAWAPRIKTGFDALLHSALNGKGAMPKQGGGAYSDYEIARAVVYMADKGGAKFEEPKPPADAASAPK